MDRRPRCSQGSVKDKGNISCYWFGLLAAVRGSFSVSEELYEWVACTGKANHVSSHIMAFTLFMAWPGILWQHGNKNSSSCVRHLLISALTQYSFLNLNKGNGLTLVQHQHGSMHASINHYPRRRFPQLRKINFESISSIQLLPYYILFKHDYF